MKPNYWNKGKLYLSNNDKILKNIIQNYPKEYLSINNNYYHCLINSIIGQQISVSAANSIKNRLPIDNNEINKALKERVIIIVGNPNVRFHALTR